MEGVARRTLLLVAILPLGSQLLGSAFNIWYNLSHIRPLLTEAQFERFIHTVSIYNLLIYPAATLLWLWVVWSMKDSVRGALAGESAPREKLLQAQRRAINLPWWATVIAGTAWLSCIPVFMVAVLSASEPKNPIVYAHLPISVGIGASIAVGHGFFAVELLSQQLLFPILFRGTRPSEVGGARPVTLRTRGIFWAISAGVAPIVSLVLLILAPPPEGVHGQWFALSVGAVAVVFGLLTAWMFGRLLVGPVLLLRRAARRVAAGNLDKTIELIRADEFGSLVDDFNRMISELREKRRLRETFGCHVGREAARQILARDPGLGGAEQELTVLFVDVRDFTARSERSTPQQIVEVLNRFFHETVEVVEEAHGGMINKFLGDGFIALFGAGDPSPDHALHAVLSGCEILERVKVLNQRLSEEGIHPLSIGIGIHTGRAVVGSIGSPRRMEYTAIGDTVNVSARVEGLTKSAGTPLLLTEATRERLPRDFPLREIGPREIRGKSEPVRLYTQDGVSTPRAAPSRPAPSLGR
ncbi:MAG: HAMP domain-containing protein [Candidatus Omnitrophica bacterium]|nr:hypothetical protein [bacterium]NUN98653.1 HAMP domain-containing protein [Candidatus Omnitrophota bacterium]